MKRILLIVLFVCSSCFATELTKNIGDWSITLEPDCVPAALIPALVIKGDSQVANRTVKFDGEKRWTVSYAKLTSGARIWNIVVTLAFERSENGITVSGKIKNDATTWRVASFSMPEFDLGRVKCKAGSANLYVPEGLGLKMSDFPSENGQLPKRWQKTGDKTLFKYATRSYPSTHLTMPWVTLVDNDGGYYIGTHEKDAHSKKFVFMYSTVSDTLKAAIVHDFFLAAGKEKVLPPAVCETYKGSWHTASKIYRKWYDSVHKIRVRAPEWSKTLSGWLLVIMRQQNEQLFWPYTDIDKICDYADKTGLDWIGLFGWTVGGHDHLYPEYDADPKMGGVDALKKGIKLAQSRGKRIILYANGQLQQKDATEFWKHTGERVSIRRKNGELELQHYHKYSDIPRYDFALGCFCAKEWYDQMLKLAKQANDFGADGILYDQLGMFSPFPCYGEGHSHPVPFMTYDMERPQFIRNIVNEMHKINPNFAVMTEGFHDTILDSIDCFHGCSTGTYPHVVPSVRKRASDPKVSGAFPELVKYTFPEFVTTTRVPAPVSTREMVNYTVLYGYRHDIELRYAPDRLYAEHGKMPDPKDYGTVVNVPSDAIVRAAPPEVQVPYMKTVNDFQRKFGKFFIEGKFVDTEGFTFKGDGCYAKRFIAKDGSNAVCVWNCGDKATDVAIFGLGEAKEICEPEAGGVSATKELAPNTIRIYCF